MQVPVFLPGERTGVLLHEPTLLACASAEGQAPDLMEFRRNLARVTKLCALVYYPGLPEQVDAPCGESAKDAALKAGFRVVEPPAAWSGSHAAGEWSKRQLAETAVEMFTLARRTDHLLLCSGDAAMTPLVELVQRNGLRVSVMSSVRNRPRLIADELRRQADQFIEYRDLASHFLGP